MAPKLLSSFCWIFQIFLRFDFQWPIYYHDWVFLKIHLNDRMPGKKIQIFFSGRFFFADRRTRFFDKPASRNKLFPKIALIEWTSHPSIRNSNCRCRFWNQIKRDYLKVYWSMVLYVLVKVNENYYRAWLDLSFSGTIDQKRFYPSQKTKTRNEMYKVRLRMIRNCK